jgi:hypothetical protein
MEFIRKIETRDWVIAAIAFKGCHRAFAEFRMEDLLANSEAVLGLPLPLGKRRERRGRIS